MTEVNSPSPRILYPEWQNEYRAALLELDREKLRERIATAEAVIFKRLQAISHDRNPTAERQAIEDALWQASALSSGTILGFLTGKRSKNHAAM